MKLNELFEPIKVCITCGNPRKSREDIFCNLCRFKVNKQLEENSKGEKKEVE